MKPEVLVFGCCYLGYLLSLYRFCENYLINYKIHKKWFLFFLLAGGFTVTILGNRAEIPYICKTLLGNIILGSLLILAFGENIGKKVFTASVLIVTKTLVWNFGCSCLSCIILIGKRIAADSRTEYISLTGDVLIGAAALVMVILVLLRLRSLLVTVYADKMKIWYLTVSVPLLVTALIVDVVNWGASNGIMVVSNANGAAYWDVYDNQIFSHLAICLLTTLGICIAAGVVFGMNRIDIEQRKREQYHAQIAYYQMLNEQYAQMERLRHDMKNHVLSLYGLWKNDDRDKLGNYLEDMLEHGDIGEDVVTGNKVIDALFYDKKKRAKQDHIRWECDVQFLEECFLDEFDLCVLFGNVLDNALNGGKAVPDREKRFLSIQFQMIKKCYLLVVKNYTEIENMSQIQPGTGLLNMQETVKKYNGTLSMKLENHVFEVSVLLPVSGHTEHGKDRL